MHGTKEQDGLFLFSILPIVLVVVVAAADVVSVVMLLLSEFSNT